MSDYLAKLTDEKSELRSTLCSLELQISEYRDREASYHEVRSFHVLQCNKMYCLRCPSFAMLLFLLHYGPFHLLMESSSAFCQQRVDKINKMERTVVIMPFIQQSFAFHEVKLN